jgi:hypothetical protein
MATSQAASLSGAGSGLAPEAETHATSWKTIYPPEAWRRIRAEGIYLGSVLVFAVLVAGILLKKDGSLKDTVDRLLYCGLGGITGSWIYSVKWYVRSVSGGIWKHDLVAWRLTSPFLGLFLAVSTYIIIQTGLLGVTFATKVDNDHKGYAYSIGFLVGLFSDDVMGKLTEVAGTLFGKGRSDAAPHPGKRGATDPSKITGGSGGGNEKA